MRRVFREVTLRCMVFVRNYTLVYMCLRVRVFVCTEIPTHVTPDRATLRLWDLDERRVSKGTFAAHPSLEDS